MEKIERLCDAIEEEIHDADKYVRWALECKDDDASLAALLNTLAGQEMDHMRMLHNAVTACIEKYKQERGAPPAEMLDRYNYLHKRHVKEASDVKILMAYYHE